MDEILTTREAAEFLKLSVATIYTLQREKKIPCKKIGGQIRFVKSELIDWMKS